MSSEILDILDREKDHDSTEAGNYFVANYPPFAYWTPEAAANLGSLLQNSATPDVPLGVYFHVPFCRKRCHFCYFRVYTDKNAEEIKGYLDAGMAELELYAKAPLFQGRKPRFVYFGGGTPSYLSVSQLQSLTQRMKELLPWDEVEEVTFECEPGTLTEQKLSALREIGVTRLSLGVENFDSRILEINGRAHRTAEIFRAYQFARSIGFPQINIDLIAGMVEETSENWQENIRQTLALEPDSVTIYQMEVPYNTGIYREMKTAGKLTAPVANWQTKRKWVDEAFHALEQSGYTVTSGYTAVRNPSQTKFVYRDQLWAGADLIGLGVASFSHVAGTHFQNLPEFSQYLEAVHAGNLPASRAHVTTPEERMIRELILQMKLGRVNTDSFASKFGIQIRDRFSRQWTDLAEHGLLKDEGPWLVLSREALLKVDTLLHAFFLPQHRGTRYT
jgi:oxygen-independent coproporphyrinogen-3 oxidase